MDYPSGIWGFKKYPLLIKNSMVNAAQSQFWRSFNLFIVNFGHTYALVKNQLFNQYCCSYYGAPLWNMHAYENICVAWRKASIENSSAQV